MNKVLNYEKVLLTWEGDMIEGFRKEYIGEKVKEGCDLDKLYICMHDSFKA